MKKGQTESYSFLIGLIIAFLILTAIGCAVYNIYKPKSKDSFDRIVASIRNLEDEGSVEGEFSLFLEKDWFVVGFGKNKDAFEYNPKCRGDSVSGKMKYWECYGIQFAQPGHHEGRPSRIIKPDKCKDDKSCLCLCKFDFPLRGTEEEKMWWVSETACQKTNAVCASFDTVDLMGGAGCCHGPFMSGVKAPIEPEERGLKIVQYKKFGDMVSLDDIEASTEKELEEVVRKARGESEKKIFDESFKGFEKCFNSEKIDCSCGKLNLEKFGNYKLSLTPETSDVKEDLQFFLIDPNGNKLDLEEHKLDTTERSFGLICKDQKIRVAALEENTCSELTLSSGGIVFPEGQEKCCENNREWIKNKELYLLNFQEGTYFSLSPQDLPSCFE